MVAYSDAMAHTSPTGFLLLDKPKGMTSHDLVALVRRLTGVRQIGHAGTLDPLASGLMILGVGSATKQLSHFVGLDKTYEAVFVLGASSNTDDAEGKIAAKPPAHPLTIEAIEEKIQTFEGETSQIPPAYSAIKMGGRRLYELARAGKEIEAKPRPVTVYAFSLLAAPTPVSPSLLHVPVRIHVSSGTYVRSLARDLGEALGTGGYVLELRRTEVGPYRALDATPLETLARAAEKGVWNEQLRPLSTPESRATVPA